MHKQTSLCARSKLSDGVSNGHAGRKTRNLEGGSFKDSVFFLKVLYFAHI